MMSWLARRDRKQFTGWIAGFGTDSGHRVVVGHWPRSPYGVVTDVMVEDPAGHRTLYAPTPQLAEFLTAAYRFNDVQVAPCRARRSGPCWTVQAGPCSSRLPSDAAPYWDGCHGWCPPSWPEPPGGWACWTFPPAGCCQGSAPVAAPATGVASGTAPTTCTPSSPPTPHSPAANWARSAQSDHRSASASAPCRADPPWSTSPPRSRLPALQMAATLHESCRSRAT